MSVSGVAVLVVSVVIFLVGIAVIVSMEERAR